MIVTERLKNALKAAGLNDSQIQSKGVRVCAEVLSNADAKVMLEEARAQMEEADKMVAEAQNKAIKQRLRDKKAHDEREMMKVAAQAEAAAIVERAQAEAAEIKEDLTDYRAKEAVKLFSRLINIGRSNGADGSEAVEHASYMVYAFLGGKGTNEIIKNMED